ncbi:MAG: hypothetical protein ACR2RD_13695 [Woeseiaceae bacterium]
MDRATAEELPRLGRLLELVSELDDLEHTLPERVQKAQSNVGTAKPQFSKSAKEAMAQSDDAHREIDRVLTRKCNRADSCAGVVKEVLAIAKLDMREANTLDNWIPDDDPTKAIYSELYWKRRTLVESLQEFVAAASASGRNQPSR